jgi:hypothetical protein
MRKFLIFTLFTFMFLEGYSQRNCASDEVLKEQIKNDPSRLKKMEEIEKQIQDYIRNNPAGGERMVITIPTVFHVLYNTGAQNISDDQIQSQLTILNQDFRALNSEIPSLSSTVFAGLGADVEINFCLAKQDPTGAPTNGITRKFTTNTSWGFNDAMKFASSGGTNAWNTSNYLNIWVCELGGGLLGYAQFPSGPANTDGIVILHSATGNIGTATPPFHLGRTATHEIGHWLNLIHIWGDSNCGNDQVSDTPVHNTSNFGCPNYPHLSTCTGSPIEMTMNYMDYSDDPCMYMFSPGQKTRMRAIVNPGGIRASLNNSPGCNPPTTPPVCSTPGGLNVMTTNVNLIQLQWTANNTPPLQYRVEYKPSAVNTWASSTSATNYAQLTGLVAGTTYDIRVRAECSSTLFSPYSNIITGTTLSGGPITGTCDDTYENNNIKLFSKPIFVGGEIKGKIATPIDKDWFKFMNNQNARNVKVELYNIPADYDMKMYRNSTLVSSSNNGGNTNELCVYNNSLLPATYYVEVSSASGGYDAEVCYRLKANISNTSFRTNTGDDENPELIIEPITDEFLIFPNPSSSGEVTVIAPLGTIGKGDLTIRDLTGKTIMNQRLLGEGGTNSFSLDVSGLANGIYVTTLHNENETYTLKLVITHH